MRVLSLLHKVEKVRMRSMRGIQLISPHPTLSLRERVLRT
jgi:hypothetical protein